MGFQSTCSVTHSNIVHSPALLHTQSAPTVAGVVTYYRVDESETRHNQHVAVQHLQLLNDTTDIIACS